MKRLLKHKRIVFTVVAILLVAIFLVRSRGTSTQNAKIEVTKVENKTLTETVSSSGKTQARQQAVLHFQTGGRLSWVGVKEGDMVSAWQTIASLDTRELRKNLEKTMRDYQKEREDFEEDRSTYKDRSINDTVRRILEKNQWDLEKSVLDVELDTIALEWSYLMSPIAGVVTHIDAPVAGVNVSAADTFTIINPSTLVFSANVDETDVGKVTIGQLATVNLDAYPQKTFPGKVVKIAFAAEITSAGATVFPVEIAFSESENIRVGLNGDVAIILSQKSDVLSIPSAALREEADKYYVIKKVDNSYKRVDISIGVVSEIDTEIISGLMPNDEVVIRGFQFLPQSLQK